jgi:hypothetical protein
MRVVVKGKFCEDFSVKTVARNGSDLQRVLKKFKKAGVRESRLLSWPSTSMNWITGTSTRSATTKLSKRWLKSSEESANCRVILVQTELPYSARS